MKKLSCVAALAGLLFICPDVYGQNKIAEDSAAVVRKQTQQEFGLDPDLPLIDRVRPTSVETLDKFRAAGMSPSEHALTNPERRQLETIFNMLPPLHQRILKDHLRSISFLDSMPNTALTSTINYGAPFPMFDITVRAAIFNQTASEWITEKERTLFINDDASTAIVYEAGSLYAMLYVMLHETTHVVDGVLKLSQDKTFRDGVWLDRTKISSEYYHALFDSTRYRGGKPIPKRYATEIYRSMSKTPFVSLYSTSSWHEDLAEYLSIYHFTRKLNQPFRITIRERGKVVFDYEPMKSRLVRSRLKTMDRFYSARDHG